MELSTLKIGMPATNALAHAGITKLEQLQNYSEKELLALHGVGPKAIRILNEEMKKQKMSFLK